MKISKLLKEAELREREISKRKLQLTSLQASLSKVRYCLKIESIQNRSYVALEIENKGTRLFLYFKRFVVFAILKVGFRVQTVAFENR